MLKRGDGEGRNVKRFEALEVWTWRETEGWENEITNEQVLQTIGVV